MKPFAPIKKTYIVNGEKFVHLYDRRGRMIDHKLVKVQNYKCCMCRYRSRYNVNPFVCKRCGILQGVRRVTLRLAPRCLQTEPVS